MEVEESEGGLGTLELVLHVLLLFVHDLSLDLDDVLLPVQLLELFDGIIVGIEVGSKAPVLLFVGVVDKGADMRGLSMEEFGELGRKGG